MVRLMLTLTPCVCILSAIAISQTLETYLSGSDAPPPLPQSDSAPAEKDDEQVEEQFKAKAAKLRKKPPPVSREIYIRKIVLVSVFVSLGF